MENASSLEIAASNLTLAYCFAHGHPGGQPGSSAPGNEGEFSQEKILHIYHEFLRRLEEMKMVDR